MAVGQAAAAAAVALGALRVVHPVVHLRAEVRAWAVLGLRALAVHWAAVLAGPPAEAPLAATPVRLRAEAARGPSVPQDPLAAAVAQQIRLDRLEVAQAQVRLGLDLAGPAHRRA